MLFFAGTHGTQSALHRSSRIQPEFHPLLQPHHLQTPGGQTPLSDLLHLQASSHVTSCGHHDDGQGFMVSMDNAHHTGAS